MTRRDYIMLAKLIKRNTTTTTIHQQSLNVITQDTFIPELCIALHNENPRFETARFMQACGIKGA